MDSKNNNQSYNKKKAIKDVIEICLVLIIVFVYVLLCSLNVQSWGKFWVIFISYPLIVSIIEVFYYKNIFKFSFPVLIVLIYLILGVYFDLWHPYWFLFLLIPIYYVIESFVKKTNGK